MGRRDGRIIVNNKIYFGTIQCILKGVVWALWSPVRWKRSNPKWRSSSWARGWRGRAVRFLQEPRAGGEPSPSPLCNNPAALANTKYKHSKPQTEISLQNSPCQSKRLAILFQYFSLGLKEVTQPVRNEGDVPGAPAFTLTELFWVRVSCSQG